MASHVFTGTATNYDDLLTKLKTHLTSGTMGAEAWTVLSDESASVPGERFLYLRGPGLTGDDQIYVGIRRYAVAGNDYYNWQIRGMVNYNPLVVFANQPGVSPPTTLCLFNSAIQYWVIASGRRFIVIAKISTTYHCLYAGFILPYATSDEMPYPMFIGASSGADNSRWSRGTYVLGNFWDAPEAASYIRHFDGSWVNVCNFALRDDTVREERHNNSTWPFEYDNLIGKNQDDTYGLLPIVIHGNYSGGNNWGEFEGVFFVTGEAEASEDVQVIGSDNYLVVQNTYRADRRSYAAIKLG